MGLGRRRGDLGNGGFDGGVGALTAGQLYRWARSGQLSLGGRGLGGLVGGHAGGHVELGKAFLQLEALRLERRGALCQGGVERGQELRG